MRVGRGSPPSRQEATRSHAPPALSRKAIPDKSLEEVIVRRFFTSIPNLSVGKCVDIMRQRGHDVVIAGSGVDALAIMRRQMFDALVTDCAEDTLDILNFTAKAQGLQPSLAVFLANEWGDELATGLEELVHGKQPFKAFLARVLELTEGQNWDAKHRLEVLQ